MISFFSPVFIFSFVVLCLILFFTKDSIKQNIITTIFSLIIYALADWRFLTILLIEILICYFSGYFIIKYEKCRKKILVVSICILISILAIFKYFNFFIDTIGNMISIGNTVHLKIIIPLGISFYTFMGISYVCDVYKGKIDGSPDFVSVAMYLSFFPHITSGPITKARDFIAQISKPRAFYIENLETGAQIFLFGLFKKMVIADRLSIYVDTVYECPNAYSGLTILFVSIAYSIQLYCDFSGYSDMAIGIAKILGINLKRNFNMPYISKNPTEFWKRWHISLSEWLQEYLYIPLGGNRKGITRTYFNLLLTMLLGGLWHGANWKYVIWGAVHGIALVIHKLFMKYVVSKHRSIAESKLLKSVSVVFTFIFVNLCWVLFRAESISQAKNVIIRIITCASGIAYNYVYFFIFAVLLVIAYYVGIKCGKDDGFYPTVKLNTLFGKTLFCLVVLAIIVYGYYGNTAFIYAQY